MTGARSLISYPPGMTTAQIEEALSLTEHSRRQLETDGVLVPVEIGRKKLYPRHQAFTLVGLVDPDTAAAAAARELIEGQASETGHTEAPTAMADAPNLVHLDPLRNEVVR